MWTRYYWRSIAFLILKLASCSASLVLIVILGTQFETPWRSLVFRNCWEPTLYKRSSFWKYRPTFLFTFDFFQLKVIAIDEQLRVIYEDNIHFDKDLPEFGYVFEFYSVSVMFSPMWCTFEGPSPQLHPMDLLSVEAWTEFPACLCVWYLATLQRWCKRLWRLVLFLKPQLLESSDCRRISAFI